MEQVSPFRLLSLVLFLAFAGISCWATTESLHLLMPSWPILFCWVVTIGLFVLSSIGSKLLVDSLNKHIYLENRGVRLVSGIVMLLAFWLFVSFPTNAHTFFYRSVVGDVASQDIATTKSYLQQLRDNVKGEQLINDKQVQLDREVETLLVALNNELDNIANPGFGPRSKEILNKIAILLQIEEVPALSYTTTSAASVQALKSQYRTMILEQLKLRKSKLRETYASQSEKHFKPEAERAIVQLDSAQRILSQMNASGEVDNNTIKQVDLTLKHAYGVVHNYSSYVKFANAEDKKRYSADDQVTRTGRLLSVFDVWGDYVSGGFAGRGFIFWIMLSLVIDIASFIFFDIAFAKKSN